MTYKKAIAQHCKDCGYDNAMPGTWRKQVEDCDMFSCALYPYRPVTANTCRQRRIDNKIIVVQVDDLKCGEMEN